MTDEPQCSSGIRSDLMAEAKIPPHKLCGDNPPRLPASPATGAAAAPPECGYFEQDRSGAAASSGRDGIDESSEGYGRFPGQELD
jgi:hypothetical protein